MRNITQTQTHKHEENKVMVIAKKRNKKVR